MLRKNLKMLCESVLMQDKQLKHSKTIIFAVFVL